MLQESVWQLSVEMYKIEKPEKNSIDSFMFSAYNRYPLAAHRNRRYSYIEKKQQTRQQEEPKTTHYKTKHKVYLTELILCQMALKQTKH